jgi:hypothetical protein
MVATVSMATIMDMDIPILTAACCPASFL